MYKIEDEKWIREQYLVKEFSLREISEKIGCSRYILSKEMKRCNIPIRRQRYPELYISKNTLEKLYVTKKMSSCEIARLFKVSIGSIRSKMKRYGIHSRTRSEAVKLHEGNSLGCAVPQERRDRISNKLIKGVGEKIASQGYYSIAIKRGNRHVKVFEHRHIAEKKLKRKLKTNEIVHHKNWLSTDNRKENIDVCENQKKHLSQHYKERKDLYKNDNCLFIAFEGCDCSGKSTLKKEIEILSNYRFVCVDRLLITSVVYNRVFNRHSDQETNLIRKIVHFINRFNPLFVFVDAEEDVVYHRINNRGDDMIKNMKTMKMILREYREFYTQLSDAYPNNFIKVDGTVDPGENYNIILKHVEDMRRK